MDDKRPLHERLFDVDLTAPATIQAVWEKGVRMIGRDSATWRQDFEGNLIKRDEYGQHSEHGWELDHIRPKLLGGPDTLANLRPRHWRSNARQGGLMGAARRGLLDLD